MVVGTTPSIVIHNSKFINNSAIPSDDIQQALTAVFVRQIFNGRGGGLGIVLDSPMHSYDVFISNCSFVGNFAKLLGGGIYFTIGRSASHNFTLDSNAFIDNESGFAAGGSFVGCFGPGTQTRFNSFVFRNCLYEGNKADRGGGAVYAVPGTQSMFVLQWCVENNS